MHAIITDHRDEIADLCRKYRVRRLDVFGSAVRDDFDPTVSDVDFVVEFEDPTALSYADDYFTLKFSLEELLGREIDLVTRLSIENPYFLARIEATREPVYAP